MGFTIGNTYRRMVQHVSVHLRPFAITPEQFSVLFQLYKAGGTKQKDLAARTSKDQPTMTRILDVLLRKGLVEKKTCDSDRRAFIISITDAGKALMDQAIPAEEKAISEVFAGFDPAQLEQLRQMMQQCCENIERHTNE